MWATAIFLPTVTTTIFPTYQDALPPLPTWHSVGSSTPWVSYTSSRYSWKQRSGGRYGTLPCPTLHQYGAVRQVDVVLQYDELPNALVVTPIVNNKGLTYLNWDYVSTQAVQVGGVESKTSPSRIVSRASGELAFTPQDPFFSFFSPQYFFFGCTARVAQAAATVATPCDITVRGYDAKNNKVAEQSFSFKPPLSPVAPVDMTLAALSSAFSQKLKKVTIEYPTQTLAVLLMDNFAFRVYP